MIKLVVAVDRLYYAGKEMMNGETFDAHDADVRVLTALGRAHVASEVEKKKMEEKKDVVEEAPRIAKSENKSANYKTREMRAKR